MVGSNGNENEKETTDKIASKYRSIKRKKLRKQSRYLSALKVSGAKGTKKFVKTSGSKRLTINSKTGKIKVKKRTKRGTYYIKVKVTSAAAANYNAKTSPVKKIKVRVK